VSPSEPAGRNEQNGRPTTCRLRHLNTLDDADLAAVATVDEEVLTFGQKLLGVYFRHVHLELEHPGALARLHRQLPA
jgi:hypothetical protein